MVVITLKYMFRFVLVLSLLARKESGTSRPLNLYDLTTLCACARVCQPVEKLCPDVSGILSHSELSLCKLFWWWIKFRSSRRRTVHQEMYRTYSSWSRQRKSARPVFYVTKFVVQSSSWKYTASLVHKKNPISRNQYLPHCIHNNPPMDPTSSRITSTYLPINSMK